MLPRVAVPFVFGERTRREWRDWMLGDEGGGGGGHTKTKHLGGERGEMESNGGAQDRTVNEAEWGWCLVLLLLLPAGCGVALIPNLSLLLVADINVYSSTHTHTHTHTHTDIHTDTHIWKQKHTKAIMNTEPAIMFLVRTMGFSEEDTFDFRKCIDQKHTFLLS